MDMTAANRKLDADLAAVSAMQDEVDALRAGARTAGAIGVLSSSRLGAPVGAIDAIDSSDLARVSFEPLPSLPHLLTMDRGVNLPLVNPGSGLGVYVGALSSTDAMYTRSPASGEYGSLRVPGYQAHHLNQNAVYKVAIPPANGQSILLRGNAFIDAEQNAVYKVAIPPANGQSILLRGNAFIDAGSSHFEAHASLERWWDSYRAGGEMALQRPTNAQYGEALKQSLIDSGMSPSDAAQHAEAARQQRLASGLAEDGLVPKVPRRINQPGTNVVDADLWAARGLAKNLAIAGRGLTAVGIASDGYSLYSQYQQSAKTGDYSNTYREGVRVAGGWAGAYAVGAAGAEFGAAFGMAFSPVGAVVGGFVGGLIGGGIGYFGGSYASVGVATDLGLLPPGVLR